MLRGAGARLPDPLLDARDLGKRPSGRFFVPAPPKQPTRKIALALTAALSLAIFALALLPLPIPPPQPGVDKTHHLVAFAALVLPATVLWPRLLPWVLPGAVLQAGLIEIVQPYVNRAGEWADFTAGLRGILAGMAVGLALHFATRKSGLFRL